jgi:hypothetical protein
MMQGGQPGQGAPATPTPDTPIPPTLARKIIYDAQVDLLIDNIDPTAEKLVKLVSQAGGYVAEQNISGSPGSARSGRWKVRVPVERFEDFVADLIKLGELERNQRTSQDVSEQFYDIEARVRNKQVEEKSLTKILEERSGKLEDVLKVEVELSRVRGEIEQLQGRLRVLDSLSSLATVTVNLRERDRYEPPAPQAPSFATQITRAWNDSIQSLADTGKALVLFVVAIAPWLPLILIGLLLVYWFVRAGFRWLARILPRAWDLARRPIVPARTALVETPQRESTGPAS